MAGPAGPSTGIQVEGVRELTAALNKLGRQDLTKAMGANNKAAGNTILDRLQPLPASVGLGAGANVRASANARLVQLIAGGAWRNAGAPYMQWGKKFAPRSNPRPDIAGSALRVMPTLEDQYMGGIDAILKEVSA